ncbi:MAG: TfoX/Sxy family protein [Devosia sp.]
MSEASDALAARLRALLARRKGIVEKRMFGGVGFMLRGNMLIGTTSKGAMLVRVGPDRQSEALKRKGAFVMTMGERAMSGFIAVDEKGLEDTALKSWIAYADTYVKGLPDK